MALRCEPHVACSPLDRGGPRGGSNGNTTCETQPCQGRSRLAMNPLAPSRANRVAETGGI